MGLNTGYFITASFMVTKETISSKLSLIMIVIAVVSLSHIKNAKIISHFYSASLHFFPFHFLSYSDIVASEKVRNNLDKP